MALSILSSESSGPRPNSIPGEQTLLSNYSLTVTNCRVQYSAGGFRSVMLDQVATCSVSHEERSWLAIVAGLLALVGFFLLVSANQVGGVIASFILAVVFLAAYYATRQSTLRISTAGTSIVVPVTGKHVDEMIEVIRTIESARWRVLASGFGTKS